MAPALRWYGAPEWLILPWKQEENNFNIIY